MQRVVRLDWFSRIEGNRVEWFTTERDGRLRLKQLQRHPDMVNGHVQVVFVPVTRGSLVEWLNVNLKSVNV